MKIATLIVIAVCLFISNFVSADTFGTGENQFEIEFTPILGDASSANGTSVTNISPESSYYRSFTDPGNFRIGTYEISNDQWSKFQTAYGTPTGSPASAYDADPYWTGTEIPTNSISWFEAAQFVNWLNVSNGYQAAYKFTGAPGTNNYTFSVWSPVEAWGGTNLYRHKDAFYFLPTENEWIKAAYWNGNTLQTYSNASPTDLISGQPDPTKWNYQPTVGSEPWTVSNGVQELNGTFNMMGNIHEWVESSVTGDFLTDSYRVERGGAYSTGVLSYNIALSDGDYYSYPDFEWIGFRVASVPEPCTLSLLAIGAFLLRKRK